MVDFRIPPEVMPYVNPKSHEEWQTRVQQAKADPADAVQRFVESYAGLVAAVEQAIAEGQRRQEAGELDASVIRNLASWQTHTLPLLQKHNAAIQAAAAQFHVGDPAPIARHALEESGLSRNLDGYFMSFVDPKMWKEIETRIEQVVLTACSSAELG